ncbi:hypothetical protein CBR_g53669 [Chara braunii]|uniref:Uncharacterized protein n=1 Tax=Chara braunii TaxID=69332 RepID=A0A388MB52_CHABU|nr:hypothetical protein CBR_g53669 [Chara braunii]|eukprot:GBG91780.1 hypothetical protein CBR_g53669 [Chara braunii]
MGSFTNAAVALNLAANPAAASAPGVAGDGRLLLCSVLSSHFMNAVCAFHMVSRAMFRWSEQGWVGEGRRGGERLQRSGHLVAFLRQRSVLGMVDTTVRLFLSDRKCTPNSLEVWDNSAYSNVGTRGTDPIVMEAGEGREDGRAGERGHGAGVGGEGFRPSVMSPVYASSLTHARYNVNVPPDDAHDYPSLSDLPAPTLQRLVAQLVEVVHQKDKDKQVEIEQRQRDREYELQRKEVDMQRREDEVQRLQQGLHWVCFMSRLSVDGQHSGHHPLPKDKGGRSGMGRGGRREKASDGARGSCHGGGGRGQGRGASTVIPTSVLDIDTLDEVLPTEPANDGGIDIVLHRLSTHDDDHAVDALVYDDDDGVDGGGDESDVDDADADDDGADDDNSDDGWRDSFLDPGDSEDIFEEGALRTHGLSVVLHMDDDAQLRNATNAETIRDNEVSACDIGIANKMFVRLQSRALRAFHC